MTGGQIDSPPCQPCRVAPFFRFKKKGVFSQDYFTQYLLLIFFTAVSSSKLLLSLAFLPHSATSLSFILAICVARFSRYSEVFNLGLSNTSSNKALRINPIFGPGSKLAVFIIVLPSILSIATVTGSLITSSTIALYFLKR